MKGTYIWIGLGLGFWAARTITSLGTSDFFTTWVAVGVTIIGVTVMRDGGPKWE